MQRKWGIRITWTWLNMIYVYTRLGVVTVTKYLLLSYCINVILLLLLLPVEWTTERLIKNRRWIADTRDFLKRRATFLDYGFWILNKLKVTTGITTVYLKLFFLFTLTLMGTFLTPLPSVWTDVWWGRGRWLKRSNGTEEAERRGNSNPAWPNNKNLIKRKNNNKKSK